MKKLKLQFEGKGTQRNFKFTQLKRHGNVALYSKESDGSTYYEVIIIDNIPVREVNLK